MMRGIDVSSWQGAIDLAALDIDFCISKATEGVDYVNPCCDGVIQQAVELGKKWGFYHFAQGLDPVREADFFVDNCSGYFHEGLPVLDYEADALALWSVDDAKTWLDRVQERTGVKPLIYMSESVVTSRDWSSVASADYGLWVARYPDIYRPSYEDAAESGVELAVGSWGFAAIWQFASDLHLEGYAGDLDGNLAFMDASSWDAYAGKSVQAEFAQESRETNSQTFENENLKITVEFK